MTTVKVEITELSMSGYSSVASVSVSDAWLLSSGAYLSKVNERQL